MPSPELDRSPTAVTADRPLRRTAKVLWMALLASILAIAVIAFWGPSSDVMSALMAGATYLGMPWTFLGVVVYFMVWGMIVTPLGLALGPWAAGFAAGILLLIPIALNVLIVFGIARAWIVRRDRRAEASAPVAQTA